MHGQGSPSKAEDGVKKADGNQASHAAEVANHGGAAAGQRDGSDGEKGSQSPDASRSASNNNASKLVGNSNGVNGHRSATAGSRTGLDAQHLHAASDRRCGPSGPESSPVSGMLADAIMRSVGLASERSQSPHERMQRTGSTPPEKQPVLPVGIPMPLPVLPQVPAANAETMRAPRLGDK